MRNIDNIILFVLSLFLSGCQYLIPQKEYLVQNRDIMVEDINVTHFNKALSVKGDINPLLKASLIANFKSSVVDKNCFKRSGGWTSFIYVHVVDTSYDKDNYNLSVPIVWEDTLGNNSCKFELNSIYLQISYPNKKYISAPIYLLLGTNNDNYFKIDNHAYYSHDENFNVRYLTGIDSLKCSIDSNKSTRFSCKSNLDSSNIKIQKRLPTSLDYKIDIRFDNR